MKSLTVWKYSIKTEAERLLHCAHQVSIGFFRANNFIVLPYTPKTSAMNTVTFPDIPYKQIPRFWERVKGIDVINLPVKCDQKLKDEVEKLLESAGLPAPNFKDIQKLWAKAEKSVIKEIYKIIPAKKNKIKKIIIFPTSFSTNTSFNWINSDGEIILYLRNDQGIGTITEAIITSLTRKDIYDDLDGVWSESELITDWLITKSSLAKVISKYDKRNFLPTIKGTRVKQQAKFIKESEEFYKKLGLPTTLKAFSIKNQSPQIYNQKIENLTITENKVLINLIKNANEIVTFDDIGNTIFKSDDDFSLYAIAKLVQRLRNKLEANGISGSYIQTLRGKGYLLRN
jgi:hypothetical protein